MFEGGDQLLINAVVVSELATGVRPDAEANLRALLEPLEFVQPGPDAALTAGLWRARARALGSTLSLADALIAAAAHVARASVVTRNTRDFALTPVTLESY